ncbi:MAG: hypothetical protein KF836_04495 [Fimbriimonadaceae bacterium]|nr:hypothetical protein [Fimbriimonadaceae bacterium]
MPPKVETRTLEAEGHTWEYVFAKPTAKPKGLIIAMHGAGGSGPQFNESALWAEKATKAGFAVVLPSGQPSRANVEPNFRTNPRTWNSGQLNSRSPRARINDMAFLDKLVKTCFKETGEVPIFVSGHSNGAGMSFRVAYEWSDRVAGIGIMSGSIALDLKQKSKKQIPTYWLVGEKDPLTPFEGGTTKLEIWGAQKENESVLSMLQKWADWQGITSEPMGGMAQFGNSEPFAKVGYWYRSSEKGDILIFLYKILGHGHAWPGANKNELPQAIVGPNVSKLDATTEFIKFFESQLKKPSS